MKKTALCLSLAIMGMGSALAADPAKINWSRIATVSVPLFFHGQSTYQRLRSDEHKGAAREVKVAGFAKQGCWLTCHDGQRDSPKQFTKEEIDANALMKAIKRSDVRKYLPDSRTDPSDWKTSKSLEEIAKLKATGYFVDLIQWRAHRSQGPEGGRRLQHRPGCA